MMNFVRWMRDTWNDGWEYRYLLGAILVSIMVIPVVIYVEVQEHKEWEAFKASHDCRIVAQERGRVSTGIGYSSSVEGLGGPVVILNTTPEKTGWLCSDGVTYWR